MNPIVTKAENQAMNLSIIDRLSSPVTIWRKASRPILAMLKEIVKPLTIAC